MEQAQQSSRDPGLQSSRVSTACRGVNCACDSRQGHMHGGRKVAADLCKIVRGVEPNNTSSCAGCCFTGCRPTAPAHRLGTFESGQSLKSRQSRRH